MTEGSSDGAYEGSKDIQNASIPTSCCCCCEFPYVYEIITIRV